MAGRLAGGERGTFGASCDAWGRGVVGACRQPLFAWLRPRGPAAPSCDDGLACRCFRSRPGVLAPAFRPAGIASTFRPLFVPARDEHGPPLALWPACSSRGWRTGLGGRAVAAAALRTGEWWAVGVGLERPGGEGISRATEARRASVHALGRWGLRSNPFIGFLRGWTAARSGLTSPQGVGGSSQPPRWAAPPRESSAGARFGSGLRSSGMACWAEAHSGRRDRHAVPLSSQDHGVIPEWGSDRGVFGCSDLAICRTSPCCAATCRAGGLWRTSVGARPKSLGLVASTGWF